jgi:integrase
MQTSEVASLRLVSSILNPVIEKKDYINHKLENEPKYGVLFIDFITISLTKKINRMGIRYCKNYNSVLLHLRNFQNKYDVNIFTNSVNEEFLDDFIVYLEELQLRQNTISNLIGMIKYMIRKAGSYGYAVDPTFDDITVSIEESFAVYLSMNDITRIYYFEGLTRKQQRIRDLFVVGCLTALRYSDYSTLTKSNFNNGFINKLTKKTHKKVIIPIHDYITEIYEKYDGEISSGLSVQHFNRYIKLICKKIGFIEPITFSYTQGGKIITVTKEKWELISSHTARRSAATNMYMTGRMKLYEIMSITGHTTEKSFFRYIKITLETISRQIAGDSYFRK